MKRRDFVVSSALSSIAAFGGKHLSFPTIPAANRPRVATRKILIAGGAYGTVFIKYMAQLTGKRRPKLLYLPTASADSPSGILNWYKSCAPLEVEPMVQESFIASTRQSLSWEESLLSVDGIVCSGGNTLNQQAI